LSVNYILHIIKIDRSIFIFILQVLGQQIQLLIFLAINKIRVQIFSVQLQELLPLVKQVNLPVSALARHLELIYLVSNKMHNKLLHLVKRVLLQVQISLVQIQVNYNCD